MLASKKFGLTNVSPVRTRKINRGYLAGEVDDLLASHHTSILLSRSSVC